MPDILGRYTLLEMREQVRRCIDAIRVSVVPVANPTAVPPQEAGDEIGDITVDPLFSNPDINYFLNSALTMTFVDMTTGNEEVFEDEETISVRANVMEYSLPDDMCQLRSAWWKRPERPYTIVPRQRRLFMQRFDEAAHLLPEADNGAPTYHLLLNQIVLNEPERVRVDNPQGILVVYIKWQNFLDLDGDVLETQFARIMQEVVVRRASIELIEKRTKLDASSLRPDLADWTDRLMMLVRNSFNPPFINMITRHPRLRRGTHRSVVTG